MEAGDPHAADRLLPLIYAELRVLAALRMAREGCDHTLQPTALVHEAYLRIVGTAESAHWENRGHFFAAAAEAMRRILIDAARRKQTARHGGLLSRLELPQDLAWSQPERCDGLLALDGALARLEQHKPELAQLVKLRYFAGLSVEQSAQALGISDRTVKRYWSYARAWLRREMDRE